MNLIEVLAAIGIAVTLLASLGSFTLGRKPYALHATVESMRAFVADARSVGATSGQGATIVIAPRDGGFVATLYPYRPLAGADLSSPAVRTLSGNAAVTGTAIFISSSGTTSSSATWLPASGTLSSEPACTNGTQLTIGDGFATETHVVPCGSAELQ
ncbi:MAG: hypothetical protein ACREMT_01910 [Vulcanimicrobiaceae bacterium]